MKLGIMLEEEEDGTYSVHCPALKGCHSQSTTKEEALKNIREAIELYLEVSHERARKSLVKQPRITMVEMAI